MSICLSGSIEPEIENQHHTGLTLQETDLTSITGPSQETQDIIFNIDTINHELDEHQGIQLNSDQSNIPTIALDNQTDLLGKNDAGLDVQHINTLHQEQQTSEESKPADELSLENKPALSESNTEKESFDNWINDLDQKNNEL